MSLANIMALQEFSECARIPRDPYGRCAFDAAVIIRAGGRGGAETLRARISFDAGDREQLTLHEGSVLIAGELPLGYSTDFGEWSHEDGALIIRGNYRRLFDYTTEVRVAV